MAIACLYGKCFYLCTLIWISFFKKNLKTLANRGIMNYIRCLFSEIKLFIFRNVCQNKKRLYLCSPFDLKISQGDRKKFFEKIEASLAEANSSKINTPILRWNCKSKRLNNSLLQWRVWSWLRMNASGRLNTCKSNGKVSSEIHEWRTGA